MLPIDDNTKQLCEKIQIVQFVSTVRKNETNEQIFLLLLQNDAIFLKNINL